LQRSYPAGSRLYVLEEHRYRIRGGVLQMVVDAAAEHPVNVIDGVEDFQVLARLEPTPAVPDPPLLEAFDGIGWTALAGVEITLRGHAALRDHELRREWSANVVPRNVM
jgi:hypothetical protein